MNIGSISVGGERSEEVVGEVNVGETSVPKEVIGEVNVGKGSILKEVVGELPRRPSYNVKKGKRVRAKIVAATATETRSFFKETRKVTGRSSYRLNKVNGISGKDIPLRCSPRLR